MKRTTVFFAGTCLALGLALTSFDISSLEAVSKTLSLAQLPSELRMAIDLGIIDRTEAFSRTLDVPMKRREFALLLKKTLMLLGDSAGSTLRDLFESGIFEADSGKKSLSRKQALESMCRMVIHLADKGVVKLDIPFIDSFSDYKAPAKYHSALAYLIARNVAKGYGSGRFGVSNALTKREGAYLIYRLYEQVASAMVKKASPDQVCFVDLPTDHFAMASIRNVAKAGGFDLLNLRPSFDGNNYIAVMNASKIVKGILTKADKGPILEELGQKIATWKAKAAICRKDFAILMELLINAGTPKNQDSPEIPTYVDITPHSPEGTALEALGKRGILMGYADKTLRGEEFMTWFETVGVLDAVLKTVRLSQTEEAAETPKDDRLVSRSEFEEFVNVVKAKRARVHNILGQNPVRKRGRSEPTTQKHSQDPSEK